MQVTTNIARVKPVLQWRRHVTSFFSVSHRRLDVKRKQDSDPDKKHLVRSSKEKHGDEHGNKKRHDEHHSHAEHVEHRPNHTHQIRKGSHEEELKKRQAALPEVENMTQKGAHDPQSDKHKPEPTREKLSEAPKKMRNTGEIKAEKHSEEPKKLAEDLKRDKNRDDDRQRQRPANAPSEKKEKTADVHKPLFER